ncbi:hypothetical protein FBALC1_07978 [Flavobacteriales bacterium ALC-1]|nr:hypothetical protein FBALC1_07978 [Flavobacteriales bacterium ALC-1]
MKKSIGLLVVLFLALGSVANSQVIGIVLMDSLSLPGAVLELKRSKSIVTANFDGEFTLPIKSEIKKDDLFITYAELTIQIKNVDLDTAELNIGEIEIPYFKSIEIEEYEQLSELEKENCIAINHWAQLLGYLDLSRLENDYIILNCSQEIIDYTYDLKAKTITVDWSVIKNCI